MTASDAHKCAHHHHKPAAYDRAFAMGALLNLTFVIVEITYGFWANSLALLADASHNAVDVLGLLLAWGAVWLAQRQPTPKRTYGYGRSSIMAALVNAVLLLVAMGGLGWEAVHRLFAQAPPVAGHIVFFVAGLGILVNGGTALLFRGPRSQDLNRRAAYLHMAADAAISACVVVAALIIVKTGWFWLDPALSLAIGALITLSTVRLLVQAVNLSIDAVPEGIDTGAVEAYLGGLPGVIRVHDLHIWPLSTSLTALTAHLVRPNASIDDNFNVLVTKELKNRFGIGHTTLQIESGTEACGLESAETI